MMATTAVVGLNAGKRLLRSSFYYSDVTEKFLSVNDLCSSQYYYHIASTRSGITAKKTSSSSSSNYSPSFHSSSRHTQSAKALQESVDVVQQWLPPGSDQELEEDDDTVEALLLLQRSLLEKQWNLSFEKKKKIPVTCSGISARQRRMGAKKKTNIKVVNSDLFQNNRVKGGYVKGVISDDVLSHAEVVRLSKKIKSGLRLDEHKSRLKDRLGCEPSDEQLATSLKISRAELQAWLMECNLAREKLAMSNVRLVMSIAQRYDNMGAEMSDLVQGGLIGLLRGIEKFDSSKERDDILLEKLNAIDKKLESKLSELDHTFGKKGKRLEEEIRDLAEDRNALTEKKRQPLYRKGYDVHVIDVKKVAKVTKGGRVERYTALMVCGNYEGVIGYAKAKAETGQSAMQKAYEKCFQNLHYIERHEEHTIAHAIQTSYKKTKLYLWPAPTTTGMKAGRVVKTMLLLAGFKNIKSKVIGSRNSYNTVKAVLKALNAVETPKDVQEKFGRTVVEKYL
ncbi:hypothetical protein F2Q70_00016599, partial [Brassica cretica]